MAVVFACIMIIFQYHKGAIQSRGALGKDDVQKGFQYHKGAIQRLMADLLRPSSSDFNTTRVRFRGLLSDEMHSPHTTFQYHKGAIQSPAGRECPARWPAISIPQGCDSESETVASGIARSTYFNTTRVRFRAGTPTFAPAPTFDFNTTRVRFRVPDTDPGTTIQRNFNTTRVRFRVCQSSGTSPCARAISIPQGCDSESRIGRYTQARCPISIPQGCDSECSGSLPKATTCANFNTTRVRFRAAVTELGNSRPGWISIPQGCDSEPPGIFLGLGGRCLFQYHKGAIQRLSGFPDLTKVRTISIPQGCDSELISWHGNPPMSTYFNTTRVRFRAALSRRLCTAYRSFQYHKGAIQSRQFFDDLLGTRQISIPQGCDSEPTSCAECSRRRHDFNTTRVRFRGAFNPHLECLYIQFQYHKGAIQSHSVLRLTPSASDFNTTRVRFRVHLK